MVKRVFKQEMQGGSHIYGVILTQAELDFVAAVFGQVNFNTVHMDCDVYEQLAEYVEDNDNYDLTPADGGGIMIQNEDVREEFKERLLNDLKELHGDE